MSRRMILQFHPQMAAHGIETHAGVVGIEEIGRLDQLGGGVRQFGLDDAVLDVALGADDDQQDALLRQAHELHLAERLAPARRHDHAGKAREVRQRVRGGGDHPLRPQLLPAQLALDLAGQRGQFGRHLHRAALQRARREHRIDEQPVPARRGNPAGRRMRAGDEPHFLEVGHHIADGRRREIETRVLGQGARAHGLAFGDVALDQGLEKRFRTFVHSAPILNNFPRFGRASHRCVPAY